MKHAFISNKEIGREKVEIKIKLQKPMRVKLNFFKANGTSDLN